MRNLIFAICWLGAMTVWGQRLEWAQTIGGTGVGGYAPAIVAASDGGFYQLGSFGGTLHLGGMTIQGLRGSNLYLSKWDASGQCLWVRQTGGASVGVTDVVLDSLGNIYVCGSGYDWDADFGPDTFLISGQRNFMLKLDAQGNFIWAKDIAQSSGHLIMGDMNAIGVDAAGNVYSVGTYFDSLDFDPGAGVAMMRAPSSVDCYALKLDAAGNFVWARTFVSGSNSQAWGLKVLPNGDIYATGSFTNTCDFDPSAGVASLSSVGGGGNAYLLKLNSNGTFGWVRRVGTGYWDTGWGIDTDGSGNVYVTGCGNIRTYFTEKLSSTGTVAWHSNIGGYGIDVADKIYITGYFNDSINLHPTNGSNPLIAHNRGYDGFMAALDFNNNLLWHQHLKGSHVQEVPTKIKVLNGDIYISGQFYETTPTPLVWLLGSGSYSQPRYSNTNFFFCKFNQQGIQGQAFIDLSGDCMTGAFETGIGGLTLIIQPNNIAVQTNAQGIWRIDSLPDGVYTATIDSSNSHWRPNCPVTQSFTVVNGSAEGPNFGFVAAQPCPAPYVSISMPRMRPCFDSMFIFVRASNLSYATQTLDSGYVDIELDPMISVDTASLPFDTLGNNRFRFFLNPIYVGQYQDFTISSTVSCDAQVGQLLCLEAELLPLPSCIADTLAADSCAAPANQPNLLFRNACTDRLDVDIFCARTRLAYDPNDKQGFPLGVDSASFIAADQKIDYLIRFQNTGTDTAFTVVIRDTLAAEFNIYDIQSGAASHPYTFRICDERVLEWTFSRILLPDSNTNEAASHGFIRFSVAQQPQLAEGTAIHNSASIYFDFNAPIHTNQTLHTIAYSLPTAVAELAAPPILRAYPNPAQNQLTCEFATLDEATNLVLVDVLGRRLANLSLPAGAEMQQLDLSQYPDGLYFLSLENARQRQVVKIQIARP